MGTQRWPSIALLLGLLAGCEGGDDAPKKAPAREPGGVAQPEAASPEVEPVEVAPRSPGVQADGSVVSAVHWFEGSLEAALAKAKAEEKLVFVDVGAYWCPPCQQLEEEVFVVPEIGAAMDAGYVAVRIDAEKAEGPEVVREYHVQAYPTLLVLQPTGVEKGRVVDFLPAADLLRALERIEQGHSVLADVVEQLETKPDDIPLRQQLGHLYVLAGDREQAAAQFEQVMEADPSGEMGLAPKVLYDRAVFIQFKLDDDPAGAIASLRALQERFPDSPEALRAHRHIGRMLNGMGKPDEAIAELDRMLAADPNDTSLASSYGWFSFREACKPERGLEVVESALKREPENADLLYLQAELSHLTGDDAAALAAMRAASAVEPDSAFFRRQVRRFGGTK